LDLLSPVVCISPLAETLPTGVAWVARPVLLDAHVN
jgi:hypothetical protein